jgi:hypothetical protein
MTNLDAAIRQALSAEDAAFLAKMEKETPIDEVLHAFTGRWGLLNVFAAVITFAMFGAFCYCVWQLFQTADVRETVLWSLGASITMLSVAMLKIYFWMEMHKNQVLREVKRLELQIARLRQG